MKEIIALLQWFNPGRWLLISALFGSLVAGYFAWADHQQDIGYNKRVAENNAQTIKDVAAATKRTAELQAIKDKADKDAEDREAKLLADAGRARAESERLRSNITTIRASLPALTRDAVGKYADAASVVFDECQRKYIEVAEEVDRVYSERQTLIEAWPK
jgi:hypothetical protein